MVSSGSYFALTSPIRRNVTSSTYNSNRSYNLAFTSVFIQAPVFQTLDFYCREGSGSSKILHIKLHSRRRCTCCFLQGAVSDVLDENELHFAPNDPLRSEKFFSQTPSYFQFKSPWLGVVYLRCPGRRQGIIVRKFPTLSDFSNLTTGKKLVIARNHFRIITSNWRHALFLTLIRCEKSSNRDAQFRQVPRAVGCFRHIFKWVYF